MEHMEHIFHSHMAVTCFLVHDGRPNTLHFVFSFSIFSTTGHFMSIRIFMFTYMHIYCLWQANCVAFNAVCCLSLLHFFYCLALLLLSLFVSSFFLFLFFFVRFLFLFFLSFCDFKSNFKRFASASPEHLARLSDNRYTKDHVDAHIAHEIVVLRLPTTSRLAVHSVIERRA